MLSIHFLFAVAPRHASCEALLWDVVTLPPESDASMHEAPIDPEADVIAERRHLNPPQVWWNFLLVVCSVWNLLDEARIAHNGREPIRVIPSRKRFQEWSGINQGRACWIKYRVIRRDLCIKEQCSSWAVWTWGARESPGSGEEEADLISGTFPCFFLISVALLRGSRRNISQAKHGRNNGEIGTQPALFFISP